MYSVEDISNKEFFLIYSLVCYGILAEVEEKAHIYVITNPKMSIKHICF